MVNKVILAIVMVLMMGCTTKYVEKPIQVKVPVIVAINKPERPVYSKNDTTITYMIKVLEYTKILETLITEHNEAKDGK